MLAIHIRFLARVDEVAARKTKSRILKVIRSLEIMPGKYSFFEEEYIPSNKYHKVFVEKWYLILYQIRDQTVFVDYIIDCRQEYGWLIK
jgi:hypothetical protein